MENRIIKVQDGLKHSDEAAIILSDINRLYFSGFKSSAGLALITKSCAYLIVDFRYGEAAKAQVKHMNVEVYQNLSRTLRELFKKHGVRKVYFENNGVTLKQANTYSDMLKDCEVTPVFDTYLDAIIDNLRIIKSDDEIQKIEQAQKITEEAYLEILNYIKPGAVERDIALELEYLMRKKGAETVAFDLITITGKNTSRPHGVPGDRVVRDGDFFTMDIGARFEGYNSDMTRTVAVGHVSDEQRSIYETVLRSQKTALQKIKSGVAAEKIDSIARDIITSAGFGDCFGHATGHGVGLEIHELPTVSVKNKTLLSAGMVITCEPGIYIPDKFGVRIEDMVLVTPHGYKNFTTVPKELIIL